MNIKSQLDSVLNKKMDRSGFLKHVAIGMVAMTGAGAALRMLTPKSQQHSSTGGGYGDSAYGGVRKNVS